MAIKIQNSVWKPLKTSEAAEGLSLSNDESRGSKVTVFLTLLILLFRLGDKVIGKILRDPSVSSILCSTADEPECEKSVVYKAP